ncbi:MAG: hypothetical protein AAF921_15935, partial [Cyanobacteria bacterium P01_D01_bin.44]
MRRKISRRSKQRSRYWLASGWGLALMSFVFNLGFKFQAEAADNNLCEKMVQPTAVLSREQLVKVLSIPERSERQAVQTVVSSPYCHLPDLDIRAGVRAEREAYPLAFDPKTWLVLLYEDGEYAGYAFRFQG